MGNFRVIAYALKLPFLKHAEVLESQLKEFGHKYYIRRYKKLTFSELTRHESCCLKATFVRECLEKFPGELLVYIDVDSQLVAPIPDPPLGDWSLGVLSEPLKPRPFRGMKYGIGCCACFAIKSNDEGMRWSRLFEFLCSDTKINTSDDSSRFRTSVQEIGIVPILEMASWVGKSVVINPHKAEKAIDLRDVIIDRTWFVPQMKVKTEKDREKLLAECDSYWLKKIEKKAGK